MKVLLRFTLPILLLILVIGLVNAQNLDPSGLEGGSKKDKTSYLKIQADYLTNNVFLGRADSIITPSWSPSLGYWHKSGLYFNATANYLPTNITTSKWDNGSAELGYEFNFTEAFGGSIAFSKLFYSPTSTSVKSSISSTTTLSLNYNIEDILTPTIELDYNVNKSGIPGDFLLNAGLAHDFVIPFTGDENNMTLSPGINFNLGTQNFYKDYLLRKFKFKKIQAQVTKAIDALAPFQALDYELSLPIVVNLGKFSLTITPTDAIAVNKLPKALLNQYANTDNLFFTEFQVSLKF